SGVEFLEKAIELYPEAKRALLTAYADTDAAIRAINNVQIDHYLMKPWDPPEERLYGVVDDLLDDWQASYHPVFEGVRVIGHQWSPQSSEIRDFLGRNFVPHQWLNVETDETAKRLLTTTGAAVSSLPIVVFPDGSFLGNPSTAEIARKLGLKTKAVSASNWRMIRPRPAPMAARTAISFRRAAERDSSRLAILAQAMSRTARRRRS